MTKKGKYKILQLCNKPPFPSKDGGTIAMHNVTEGLLALGHEVKVLTISTDKHPFESDKISKEYLEKTQIEHTYIDTSINAIDAFSSLITSDSYNISRFFSSDFDLKLRQLLESGEYDIIHMESLFMTPYIHTCKRFSDATIVLRSHNLEYMIWERMARGETKYYKKKYLNYLSKKLKEYEISIINDIDGIACISSEDLQKYKSLGCKTPLINIPFGIEFEKLSSYVTAKNSDNITLFHLGAMDWEPNLEAVRWFLEKCWKKINKKHPDVELYLAGRNMPDNVNPDKLPNVKVVGEVDSAYEFMNSNDIMIVPILSAGGIRVKIIEGMAIKKAIISTAVGAEGIEYTDKKNILIANNPTEFVARISKLLTDVDKIKKIGTQGQQLVKSKYNNVTLIENLVSFYDSLIKGTSL